MRFHTSRVTARAAVTAAAGVVGGATLFATPAANAAFVSTSDSVLPGSTTVVVDLTADDVPDLRSSSYAVQDAKATWLCNHQVLPNADALRLDTKSYCGDVLMYCATRPLADNQLPTAYFASNGRTWCGHYTVMSTADAIAWMQKIFASSQGSGTP